MLGLKGKHVLVTGATSGIGQACAARFAEEHAHIAINYRKTQDRAQQTVEQVEQHGVKVFPVQADVSQESDVIEMFRKTIEEFGRLDILINNAGIQIEGPSHEIKTEDFDQILAVNLRGAYLCAREAIKHFLSRGGGGVIVDISSVHELIPRPSYIGYSVSKGGMGNLTRTLALEYAGRGIRVNAVAPGATITAINKAWTDDPEKQQEVARHIPMGRVAGPEEIAAVTAFLACDEAAYITGQTIYVDGGLTLYADFRKPWSGQG